MNRILVWDFPTRIFHWSLAISFTVAFITAESERLRDIHLISGYLMLGLIAFRLVWGLVGSRYARFSDFVRGPAAVTRYLRSLLSGSPEHHVGHNPAGAIAVVLLLGLGIATGLTGWMLFNDNGGKLVEELHEGMANAMLAVVAIHIAGVIVASALHRENLVKSMVTGYKDGPAADAIARRHGIMGIILIAALAFFGWSLAQGQLPALYDPGTTTTARERDHDD